MKGLFKSSLLVVLTLLMTNASPIPGPVDQAQAGEKTIEQHEFEYDHFRGLAGFEGLQRRALSDYERRDLEQVVQPVLQAAQPLANGVDQGATNLGYHAANAADAAGEAVNQAAAGAGDIAQGTIQGAGGTVGQLPGRVDQILQAIDNNPGILGDLDKVLLG